MITLRPMLPEELRAWHAQHVEAYVSDLVATGESPAAARRIVEGQQAEYFPDGHPAPGHEVLVALAGGERVGIAWWGPHPRRPEDAAAAFLYDIELEEAHRGQGLGRALLAAVEERLRDAGTSELTLNVFGDNAAARRLYSGSGYREVAITMAKSLGG